MTNDPKKIPSKKILYPPPQKRKEKSAPNWPLIAVPARKQITATKTQNSAFAIFVSEKSFLCSQGITPSSFYDFSDLLRPTGGHYLGYVSRKNNPPFIIR